MDKINAAILEVNEFYRKNVRAKKNPGKIKYLTFWQF